MVLAWPLLVLVFPLVVPVCPFVVLVCLLVVPVVLSVGFFVTNPKKIKMKIFYVWAVVVLFISASNDLKKVYIHFL